MSMIIQRYVDYKLFDFFQTKFFPLMSGNNALEMGLASEDYEKIFFSSQDVMRKRATMLKGVTLPLICFWRTTPLTLNKDFYGRSVLNRDFRWTDKEGNAQAYPGRFIDFNVKYDIMVESYFLDYNNRFAHDMMEMDIVRYIPFTFDGYIDPLTTRFEFVLENMTKTDKTDEYTASRSFSLTATWNVKFTIPVIKTPNFIDKVNLFLNGVKILELPHN